MLGDGFVQRQHVVERDGTASAQAEADDLDLFGGAVTASLVTRTATRERQGRQVPRQGPRPGRGRRVRSGHVEGRKTFSFDEGKVVANDGGAGPRRSR